MSLGFNSSYFCSEQPPPGSCQGLGPWWWGTWWRWVTLCLPLWKSGAYGRGHASAGNFQKSPSRHLPAPSHVYCAASMEKERSGRKWLMRKDFFQLHIIGYMGSILEPHYITISHSYFKKVWIFIMQITCINVTSQDWWIVVGEAHNRISSLCSINPILLHTW